MELITMKYFLALAETQSLREASKRLHISASALSRQIKNFEYNFRTPLFDRRTNGMFLTEEGKIVERHARRTIKEMDLAKSEIDNIHNLLTGSINFATIEGVVDAWIIPVIKKFLTHHPNIKFKAHVLGSNDVFDSVTTDKADFGIAMLPLDLKNIDIIEKFKTTLVVVCRNGHPLSTQSKLPMQQLVEQNFVLLSGRFHTAQLLKQHLQTEKINLNVSLKFNQVSLIKNYLDNSDYLSILPYYSVANEIANNSFVVLNDFELPSCDTILFVRKTRNLTHAATQFISELSQQNHV